MSHKTYPEDDIEPKNDIFEAARDLRLVPPSSPRPGGARRGISVFARILMARRGAVAGAVPLRRHL